MVLELDGLLKVQLVFRRCAVEIVLDPILRLTVPIRLLHTSFRYQIGIGLQIRLALIRRFSVFARAWPPTLLCWHLL